MKMSPPLPDRPPVGDCGIYPELPRPNVPPDDQAFRLAEVRRVREELEYDAQLHGATRRRYKRVSNALSYAGVAINAVAASCGGASVATLAGGVTAPVSLVLGVVALASGAFATTCSVAGKLLSKRITKHERIETAARTRNDTVGAVVSKALVDQSISHDEYAAVLRQAEQYRQQKIKLRTSSRADSSDLEKVKNELKAQFREELLRHLQ